jgi:hypothetical protein
MQRFALLCCTLVLAGCERAADRGTGEQAAMDTAASAMSDAPAPISLADVAGKWKIRSTDEAGGTPVEVEMVATADTSGWTLTGPDGKPVPLRVVAMEGDSIVTEAGPYESFVRKGVQVRTRTVNRLEGDKLVGTIEATYTTKSGDSVVKRLSEASRIQ